MAVTKRSQKTADAMIANFEADQNRHNLVKIKQYAEFKMIKGHSKEEAYRMAKEHILNAKEV
tara:strand:+ start:472 stop:657 length:186 start_codon:yes stop_codon:yes gene_type:complete